MGQRGPVPVPNPIAIAKGDPGKRARRARAKEPKPPKLDKISDYLPPGAKKEWQRLRKIAKEMGPMGEALFTESDRRTLETWCLACDAMEWATKEIKENGFVLESITREGHVRRDRNPAVQILKDAGIVIKDMSARFGFTPADRARMEIEIPEGEKKDKIEEALNG